MTLHNDVKRLLISRLSTFPTYIDKEYAQSLGGIVHGLTKVYENSDFVQDGFICRILSTDEKGGMDYLLDTGLDETVDLIDIELGIEVYHKDTDSWIRFTVVLVTVNAIKPLGCNTLFTMARKLLSVITKEYGEHAEEVFTESDSTRRSILAITY